MKKWCELTREQMLRYEEVRESVFRQTQDPETSTIAGAFAVGLDPAEVL